MPSLDTPDPNPKAQTAPAETVPAATAMRLDRKTPSIHPDGRKFMVITGALTVLLWLVLGWSALGWLMLGATIALGFIFRDPVRTTPVGAGAGSGEQGACRGLFVAPVDGLVTEIAYVAPPAALAGEEGLGDAPLLRITIGMGIFDCQIVRAPIDGGIATLVHSEGRLFASDSDEDGENERLALLVARADGLKVGLAQATGIVGHRILPWVELNEEVIAGQRIGIVRFGSRTEVYLPAGTGSLVLLGQRTVAGETVIAKAGVSELIEGVAQ